LHIRAAGTGGVLIDDDFAFGLRLSGQSKEGTNEKKQGGEGAPEKKPIPSDKVGTFGRFARDDIDSFAGESVWSDSS